MTFLNTTILIGLIAGSIPIIIHLITKQKAKTVLFSTLRFLKELKNQQIRKIKIKQILLLIIRTLIVLFLILAFARPTLEGHVSSSLSSTAKTSAVIIFDNSLSMGIESEGLQLFDRAKKKLAELKNIFSIGDELFGIYASTGANDIFDGPKYDFQTVSRIIRKLKVSQNSTDLTGALLKAKSILQESENVNKEIYFVTDLQKNGFNNLNELVLPIISDKKIKVFLIPINDVQPANLTITSVKLRNQIIEKGKVFEIDVKIKNSGIKDEKNKLVQVFINEKRSGQASVSIKQGESRNVKFRIVPQETGLIHGSILVEEDDLMLDNRHYFSFFVPEQNNVLLIGQKTKDVRFLKLALSPNSESESRLKIDHLPPSKIEFNTLNSYQVVVLSNISRIEGPLLSIISGYVKNGGGLILFPGNDVDLRNYNENLNKTLGLPAFTETIGELGSRQSYLTLGKIDYSHPIFSGVFESKKKEIESPKFYFLTKLKLKADAVKIIEFSNGEPFLLECNSGHGKIFLFSTAIDPNWSDLYLKGMFVPVLNRSVSYLAGNTSKSEQTYFINSQLSTTINNAENITEFEIEKPDKKRVKVVPKIGDAAYRINFEDTDMAGIYSLYSENKLHYLWAVNSDPEESEIEMIQQDGIEQIIGKDNLVTITNDELIENAVLQTRYGNELWRYFIGIVLILLILEMVIAREPEKQVEEIVANRIE